MIDLAYFLLIISITSIITYIPTFLLVKKINYHLLTTNIVIIVYAIVVVFLNLFLSNKPAYFDKMILYSIYFYIVVFSVNILLSFYHINSVYSDISNIFDIYNRKTDSIYLIFNRKLKIKKISNNLLVELGLDYRLVRNKKLLDILNKTVRVSKINNKDIDNNTLIDNLKNMARDKIEYQDIEIQFYNSIGKLVFLSLIIEPKIFKNLFLGFTIIGQKKKNVNLVSIEKELEDTNFSHEMLQQKFIAALDLSYNGYYFRDLNDDNIWINDFLKNILNLSSNTINYNSYMSLMQEDDMKKYIDKLSHLSLENPNMIVNYRMYHNNYYYWYTENTRYVCVGEKCSIIASIKPLKTSHFQKTDIEILDTLKSESELVVNVDNLIKDHKMFHLAIFKIVNYDKIVSKHTRDIMNLSLSKYIYKIRKSFITQSGDIFRLSEDKFSFIISDSRKFDILKTGFNKNKSFMDMKFEYGSISDNLEINIGISILNTNGYISSELIFAANNALMLTLNKDYTAKICYAGNVDEE